MKTAAPILTLALALGLTACVATQAVVVAGAAPPATDALYAPRWIEPGRLAYAPDRTTFAPILTERVPYPTQVQADDAYHRYLAAAPPELLATSVRLFGCRPGALDARTARVVRLRGPVVHCATDFLAADGRPLGRRPVNFVYSGAAWVFEPVNPPRSRAPWIDRERSPRDPWWWIPGRDRYR